jgi:hypothetical protein
LFRPAGKTSETVEVQGAKFPLYFNVNTYSEFQRVTEEHILPMAFRIIRLSQNVGELGEEEAAIKVFEILSIRNMHALIHGAIQEYDVNGTVTYPCSLDYVGGSLTMPDLIAAIPAMVQGLRGSFPGAEHVPPSVAAQNEESEDETDIAENPPRSDPTNGGTLSTPSDADVLGSLITISEDAPSEVSSSAGENTN